VVGLVVVVVFLVVAVVFFPALSVLGFFVWAKVMPVSVINRLAISKSFFILKEFCVLRVWLSPKYTHPRSTAYDGR
jgi:hypothetical protein